MITLAPPSHPLQESHVSKEQVVFVWCCFVNVFNECTRQDDQKKRTKIIYHLWNLNAEPPEREGEDLSPAWL